jgi:hypothetical protein
MHFIGYELNMPFYLLRNMYKMSKRFKRQSLNSSLFHHGLNKILLIHHLTTVGDCWDDFLTRNGFVTVVPVEIPNSHEPLIKKQPDIPSNEPSSLNKNPLDETRPSRSSHEQKVVKSELAKPHVPNFDVVQSVTVKLDVKKSCKQMKQKHTTLGFQNKGAGRFISRKLRNRNDAHLSSINPIEVNEVSDSEIEDFLVLEVLDCQRFDLAEPYDFVTNLPPRLRGKEGISGIGFARGQIAGEADTTMLDHTLHQHVIPSIQCDVCLHWIERYYIDIPILQAPIKTLTTQSELLRKENLNLRENAERQVKRLKRTGNIVIKNASNVKAIINSELP